MDPTLPSRYHQRRARVFDGRHLKRCVQPAVSAEDAEYGGKLVVADQMVLRAQQWVNRTYAGRTGYNPCEETGKTGWPVMWSLTRALQIELGMTSFADNVGPGTIARLEQHGSVDGNDANVGLKTIVQAALYCKGYNAGEISGDWGGSLSSWDTGLAVSSMMADMGLSGTKSVPPKVFKALLTMDAYKTVNGGDDGIREVQQWLNRTYWSQPWASIAPCDGHSSRDVQKALVRALQSEMGFTGDNITGSLGPLTRQTLRNHVLQNGDSGRFVELLSTAAVLNGPLPDQEGALTVRTALKQSFDEPLKQYLGLLQGFAQLEIQPSDIGVATYATWCELLVSNGDPDRNTAGCDTSSPLTPTRAAALKAADYEIVGRYLQNAPVAGARDKRLQDGEVALIHRAGLRLFPIWQFDGGAVGSFTYAAGVNEGQLAHDRMAFYGFGYGSICYFAVDFDAMDPDIDSGVVPYFRGVQAGFKSRGRHYQIGVYGPRNVCSRVTDEAGASASFVSGMSTGFSGNLGFPLPVNWSFNQIKEWRFNAPSDPFALDNDVWNRTVDAGIGPENMLATSTDPISDVIAKVRALYNAAVAYGGADPNARTMEYLRSPRYTDDYPGWYLLIGTPDRDWIQFADDKIGPFKLPTFSDPILNVPIQIDHLAASAHAVLHRGEGSGGNVRGGDFGGWAGDLASFACEYTSSTGLGPQAFCNQRIAKIGVASSWSMGDMIEDVDGAAIGRLCASGMSFPDAFESRIGTSGTSGTRFQDFVSTRFGSSRTTIKEAAHALMFDTDQSHLDSLTQTLRNGLYLLTSPAVTPVGYTQQIKDGLVEGVADVLESLASTG